MSELDRFGLALSTTSGEAAAAYREGIDLMLSAWPGADAAFEQAIKFDPDCAMAHAARARVYFSGAEPAKAKAAIALARSLVSRRGTDREKNHIETLALGMEGHAAQSLKSALSHLELWPRDAVIMSLPLGAFGLFAFSGMADHDQARVALCDRYAQHYGDDWWFQSYRGWSHTENGNVVLGRELTQRSLAMRRANANAAHALTHAMFEDGSTAEADAFITGWLPDYDRRGILFGHIYWHQALAALEHGDAERALTIYIDQLRPAVSAAVPLNAMTDCASLLWRMRLSGVDVPPHLWTDIAEYGEAAFPHTGVTFADVHMAFIAAATGNRDRLESRIAALEQRLKDGKLAAGPVVVAICRATRAFADADYAGCIEILGPAAGDVVRIGGSHAQREIIDDMLVVASIKSGDTRRALAMLDARLHHAGSVRDHAWRAEALLRGDASRLEAMRP